MEMNETIGNLNSKGNEFVEREGSKGAGMDQLMQISFHKIHDNEPMNRNMDSNIFFDKSTTIHIDDIRVIQNSKRYELPFQYSKLESFILFI